MPRSAPPTPTASVITGERAARRLAAVAAETFAGHEAAVALVDKGNGQWQVTMHFRTAPDREALRALTAIAAGPRVAKALRFETLAARNWAHDSLAGLRPVEVGRFVIHGAYDRAQIPVNSIAIEIEAALAFGTGHHGTTRGCLLMLDWICKSQRGNGRILDLGTGSGVLAIAAARALRSRVLAADIDLSAVAVARANVRLNRAGALVEVVQADGVAAPRLHAEAPYSLILANILLGPLKRLAVPLQRLVAPGGRIVLSGILPSQANAVIAAYRPLALERRLNLEGWTTLVFARRAGSVARRARAP